MNVIAPQIHKTNRLVRVWRLTMAVLGSLSLTGCSLAAPREPAPVSPRAMSHYTAGKGLLRAGKEAEAKTELLKATELAPQFVDAHRLYQDAAIRLCEIRPVVEKYEQLLRDNKDDPVFLYLNGRLRTDPREQQDLFSRAVKLDGNFAWGYFGLAHVAMRNQQPSRALKLYKNALALWHNENPVGLVALGIAYLRQGRNAEAAEALQRATSLDPHAGSAWFMSAKALARLDKHPEALRAIRNAVQLAPEDPEAHDLCRLLLTRHGTPADFHAIANICRQSLAAHLQTGELYVTLALAQRCAGDFASAAESYQKARTLGASPSDYANDLRLLYVRMRQYGKALEAWQDKAPDDLVFFPQNAAMPRFLRVTAATLEAEKAPSNPAAQLELARAYEGAGWLDEAATQYDLALSLAPGDSEAAAGRDRIKRHHEFCRQIRALFDENYFRSASGKPTLSMSAVLRRIHQMAARTLPSPIEGKTKTIDYTFLGQVTDFHFPPASGLQKYFWEFNQFFAVGHATGEPVQCVLMNVISWEPNREATLWGRPLAHDRIVGENAGVRGIEEVISDAHIGGQTVDRFYYVDIDRVWESVTASLELKRKRGERIKEAAHAQPWPSDPLKVRYLSCVPEILRCEAMTDIGRADDLRRKLFQDVMASIDAHELGHVLDALSYVPVGAHLLDDLFLLVQQGFSPRNLMAMTERNAQLAALAHAPEPRLTLSGTVVFVARDTELTAHARGYGELLEKCVRCVAAHPGDYVEIDPGKRLLDQFPRLGNDEIRRLAEALARQYGLPQRASKILRAPRR